MSNDVTATQQPAQNTDTTIIQQLTYTGTGSQLFVIWIGNLFFSFITLGFYHFWAKTKIRRYFHEHTLFMNEPFTYLGTGRELFVSALKFVFLFVIPISTLSFVASIVFRNSWLVFVTPALYLVLFSCLQIYATLSGMRYRANRMSWRGLRFALKVKKKDYLTLIIRIFLLNLVTLGLYRPYGDARFLELFMNNLAYGNQNFRFKGDHRDLTSGYIIYWLLIPFTLGASLNWYNAKLYRHIAKSTRHGLVEFRYNITGGELYWLGVSNWFIMIFSFYLLYPFTMHRKMNQFIETLRIRGTPDFANIKKASAEKNAAGMADYLGADEDFGF
jgi:uncharacterized membrane protein YjgN (DUF898 family)